MAIYCLWIHKLIGRWKDCGGWTYILQQPLQVLLQLIEVTRGDEALAALLQTVPAELHQLVLDEAKHAVGQWSPPGRAGRGRGGRGKQLGQTLLHLSCGLEWQAEEEVSQCGDA